MWDERYRNILQINMPTNEEMAADSKDLLLGVLSTIVMNKSQLGLSGMLAENRNRLVNNPESIGEVDELAEIAAVAEMLGESNEHELRLCLQQAESTTNKFGDDDRIIEPALGAAMLLGDKRAIHFWRDRRLVLPLIEGVEAIGFEMLYLSSQQVEDNTISSVAMSVVKVALDILLVFSLQSAGSHLCALGSLARWHGVTLANLLRGIVDKLDYESFGATGADPIFQFSKPNVKVEVNTQNNATISIRVSVIGIGRLRPQTYSVEAFNTKLWQTIQTNIDKIERMRSEKREQQRELFNKALFQDRGHVEAILKLGKDVELAEVDQRILKSRLTVAWEHAREINPDLLGQVILRVEH